jgi:AraC-like DNA-binding protein/mannose-6-phosphate isomerase-like protein (cupin superfamily)
MFDHQITNSMNKNVLNTCVYRNVYYANHLHKGFEFVFVMEGELVANVSGVPYRVRAGEALLISPFQIHSFERECQSLCYIVVFSGHWVERFAKLMTNKTPKTPLYCPDPRAEQYVRSVLLPSVLPEEAYVRCPAPDPLSAKGALYAICADFLKRCELCDRSERETEWLAEALVYIESNFTSDLSLASMAKAIGYDYEYLSRAFNRAMGVGFKALVNQYRCERAQYLIENTEDSLTDIALASGFQSVRTFNRVFKEKMGRLPSELRK